MIYLMRHGADAPDRLGGWSPYGLSDEGIRHIHAAKEPLLDYIFSPSEAKNQKLISPAGEMSA